MRALLLTLPLLLLACSSAPSVPEDATYRIHLELLSGDCGGQVPIVARVWRDQSGAHFKNLAHEGPESCRLVEGAGGLSGSCPGGVGIDGENTMAIYELGERFSGESFVRYPGACTGRYALSGDRL